MEVPAAPAGEALDQMEAEKVTETLAPLAEATSPAERLGAPLPSPQPSPTPELVAAAESPLPEGTTYAGRRAERFSAFLPTLRLLEGALLGAFLLLGGATALMKWRQM